MDNFANKAPAVYLNYKQEYGNLYSILILFFNSLILILKLLVF